MQLPLEPERPGTPRDPSEDRRLGPGTQLLREVLRCVVEATPYAVLVVSSEREVLAVNDSFLALWRLPPGSVRPGDRSPALGELQRSQIRDPAAFEEALRWGHEHPAERQVLDVALLDGRTIRGHAAPILDREGRYLGRTWLLHDSERTPTGAGHAQLYDQLAASQRSQRFLLEAADVLARTDGYTETLESLAELTVPSLGDVCLIDVATEDGAVERAAVVVADPCRQQLAEALRSYPPDPAGSHPAVQAMRTRCSVLSTEFTPQLIESTVRDRVHRDLVASAGFTGYMSVPLIAGDQVLGAMTLLSATPINPQPQPSARWGASGGGGGSGSGGSGGGSSGSGSSGRVAGTGFTAVDLTLVEDLAARVAGVVDKERRHERDRTVSHVLQASLLPSELPTFPGAEIAVRYLPATQGVEVGGDFWDVTAMPDGELALIVGDVAGHDLLAAATMGQLRSACRALRARSHSPAELIAIVQDCWGQLGLDPFATAVLARIDLSSGRLRIASAGHPLPVVVAGGRARFPDLRPAPPLGVQGAPAAQWEGSLDPGGVLVCYSDGLVEDRNRDFDAGLALLLAAVDAAPSLEPEQLADHLLAELLGADRGDDVALVVVRRAPLS